MSPSKFTENDNAISRRHPRHGTSGHGGCGGSFPPPPPPSLRINRDSHSIKKPASSPSSSSTAAAAAASAPGPVKPRHPLIIYTHSPKVIHTNPKDFMALVQKLTGMSRSDDDSSASAGGDRRGKSPATRDHGEDSKSNINSNNSIRSHHRGQNSNSNSNSCNVRSYTGNVAGNRRGIFVNNAMFAEESESSSVITTEENIGEQIVHGNSSSCSFAASPSSLSSPAINYGAYLSAMPIFPTSPSDGFLCPNQSFANLEMDPLFFAPNMRSSFSSSSSSSGFFDGLMEFRDF